MEYPALNNTVSNYDFVPLLNLNNDIQKFNDDAIAYEGKFELAYKAETPVYVGSGKETIVNGKLCRALIRNTNGVPIIPGSSLKGVVRTIAQSVSNSACCAEIPHIHFNGKKEKIEYRSNKNCKCLVCTMLGNLSESSRVFFSDFAACAPDTFNTSETTNSSCTYSTLVLKTLKPYSHYVLDVKTKYFIDNNPKGFKFYPQGNVDTIQGEVPTECVSEGTIFTGEIVFQGLTVTHLELLCFALGLDGSFPLRAGGNKPGFFGVIRPEIISFTYYSSGTYKNLKLDEISQLKKCIDMTPSKLAKAYESKYPHVKSNIAKLREILNRKV